MFRINLTREKIYKSFGVGQLNFVRTLLIYINKGRHKSPDFGVDLPCRQQVILFTSAGLLNA